MIATRRPRRGRGLVLAAAAATAAILASGLLSSGTLALDRKDLDDCQSSADVARMIQACTAIAEEKRIPAQVRSNALVKRGFGHFVRRALDDALTDFRAAVDLDPTNVFAHHEIGMVLIEKSDFDGALAALDNAVRLAPNGAASRYMRGNVLANLGRIDEAIGDYDVAIARGADKNTAFTREGEMERPAASHVEADYLTARADALYLVGKARAALADYDRAKGFRDRAGYTLIWSTLARSRLGRSDATAELAAALDAGGLTGWPKVIGELVAGRLTAAAALAAAKDGHQACEVHFYGGATSLAANDLAAARRDLSLAREGCPKRFREYKGAVALLKGLPG